MRNDENSHWRIDLPASGGGCRGVQGGASARVGGQPLPKLTLMEGTEIPDAGYAIPLSDSAYLPNCDRPENIAQTGYEMPQITNLDWPQGHQPARLSNHKDWHGL